jgi:hypothetical protein
METFPAWRDGMSESLTTLYRPVGQAELDLISASGWRAFPPRLPFQPIFYPVLTEAYAARIAEEWNTKDPNSSYSGYVTRFCVKRAFLEGYEIHEAGGRDLLEYWIPAADLPAFNANIVGVIEVTQTFRGVVPNPGEPPPGRFPNPRAE